MLTRCLLLYFCEAERGLEYDELTRTVHTLEQKLKREEDVFIALDEELKAMLEAFHISIDTDSADGEDIESRLQRAQQALRPLTQAKKKLVEQAQVR